MMTPKLGVKSLASECLARITGPDTIQSCCIPSRCWFRAPGLHRGRRTRIHVVNKIEIMKDWSASEEAFEQPDRFDLAFRFGGRKAVITNHPI
jgi:hypothetical protein